MRRTTAWILAGLMVMGLSCTKGGSEGDDDLAPELFNESVRAYPNPAWLYEKALFYFAFKDIDGDMDHPTAIVTFENDERETFVVDVNDVEVDGETAGSITFEMTVRDGDEGLYTISITDDAGHLSNEVQVFLYVNDQPREEENYFADDDDLTPGSAADPEQGLS